MEEMYVPTSILFLLTTDIVSSVCNLLPIQLSSVTINNEIWWLGYQFSSRPLNQYSEMVKQIFGRFAIELLAVCILYIIS